MTSRPGRGTRTQRLMKALAAAAIPVTVLALSTPAHAGAQTLLYTNGFEGNQLNTWDHLTGGDAQAGFEVNTGTADTGENNGWLRARQGWAREGTWAGIDGITRNSSCTARIWVRPQDTVEFALRVWDSKGNKLGETVPRLYPSTYYQSVTTPAFSPQGNTNVFVEAVISSYDGTYRTVRIDGLAVDCTT
ncbi:hypothetical protein [Streptomyces melanogenes]|uniref:hypothetical protein n=1 Tax=Streptomyces melanogenes TaxID=67326 RepID=UPI0037B23D22